MKNDYPIGSIFFAKKLKIFTFAYKNTNFLLDKQVIFVELSLKKREKSPSPMQGLCNSLANPIFLPF